MRKLKAPEGQKILWRTDFWDNLIEEYVVISSNELFSIFLEESYVKIKNGEKQEENNNIREIKATEIKEGETLEEGWSILHPEDRKFALVNKKEPDKTEKEFEKPQLGIIVGGKNKN